ncbi:hypothetical protein [Flavobacterium tegetincola]|uniref:hypothetical protein n=1 Tax=Flavobacterium tegetincola TaxID=150172 RepID=UPI000426951A|nr:hypothetical protein [Flavobacterium tegetincola]
MPVSHKFLNHNWENGFRAENAILKTDLYKPEVLIIGTNNPSTPNGNYADFFYGRNYFWTAFKNLVNGNYNLQQRRMPPNGAPQFPLNPTIEEVFDLCKRFKFSFADLISSVLINQNEINFLANDNVILNDIQYNLINDNKIAGIGGLAELNAIGEVAWNTKEIIKYLCENPQIKNIYFTRQPKGIWGNHWNEIKRNDCSKNRNFYVIYTPSGNSLHGTPRMNTLIKHWLFNETVNYNTLNEEWLQNCGVDIENFRD